MPHLKWFHMTSWPHNCQNENQITRYQSFTVQKSYPNSFSKILNAKILLKIFDFRWSKLTLCTLGLLSSCAITTWSLKAVCGRNFQTLTRIWIWAHALCCSEAESRLKEEEQMWKEVLLRRISRQQASVVVVYLLCSVGAERPMRQLP